MSHLRDDKLLELLNTLEWSPNMRRWYDQVVAERQKRHLPAVTSELFLWALYDLNRRFEVRAVQWLAGKGVSPDALLKLCAENVPSLRPLEEKSKEGKEVGMGMSPRMKRALFLAFLLGKPYKFLCADYIVAALLVDGTTLFAQIIGELSKGQASGEDILHDLRQDKGSVMKQWNKERKVPWVKKSYRFNAAKKRVVKVEGDDVPEEKGGGEKAKFLPDLVEADDTQGLLVFKGPTYYSHWMVPGRVLLGALPASREEITGILDNGVTNFACLIEWPPESEYFEFVEEYLQEKADESFVVTLYHFPIEDFEVSRDVDVIDFVAELNSLVRLRGQNVYVHCLGGHGRTGTVAIQLLMSLYPEIENYQEATVLIRKYHAQRPSCGRWRCRLPESRVQTTQIAKTQWHNKRRGGYQ